MRSVFSQKVPEFIVRGVQAHLGSADVHRRFRGMFVAGEEVVAFFTLFFDAIIKVRPVFQLDVVTLKNKGKLSFEIA